MRRLAYNNRYFSVAIFNRLKNVMTCPISEAFLLLFSCVFLMLSVIYGIKTVLELFIVIIDMRMRFDVYHV